MDYFNLMEVIVSDIVDQVFERADSLDNENFSKSDVIAYALNRVPARYVTGERGVMHSSIDTRLKFQQHTDLLFLIYEAIDIFSRRRDSDTDKAGADEGWRAGLTPHIIGEVLEESTLSIVPEIKVSLVYAGACAPMVDSNWENPYITKTATRGYYHFWPFVDGSLPDSADKVDFRITFEHPEFEEKIIDVSVDINKNRDMGRNFHIPLVLLKLKPGVSPEFLCRD